MYKGVPISFPKTVRKRAKALTFKSITGIILVIVLLLAGYLQFGTPPTTTDSFAQDISYLKETGQTLLLEKSDLLLEKVHVLEVIDGDTIKARRTTGEDIKIRYIGIDTPEIAHTSNETSEPYGDLAARLNAYLVYDNDIYLKSDATELDKYGRYLRYVFLEDGTMVNYLLIRLGYAETMTIPPNVMYQQEFSFAQTKAREENRNLWKQ